MSDPIKTSDDFSEVAGAVGDRIAAESIPHTEEELALKIQQEAQGRKPDQKGAGLLKSGL